MIIVIIIILFAEPNKCTPRSSPAGIQDPQGGGSYSPCDSMLSWWTVSNYPNVQFSSWTCQCLQLHSAGQNACWARSVIWCHSFFLLYTLHTTCTHTSLFIGAQTLCNLQVYSKGSLDPLLFCLTMHPLTEQLISKCVLHVNWGSNWTGGNRLKVIEHDPTSWSHYRATAPELKVTRVSHPPWYSPWGCRICHWVHPREDQNA